MCKFTQDMKVPVLGAWPGTAALCVALKGSEYALKFNLESLILLADKGIKINIDIVKVFLKDFF